MLSADFRKPTRTKRVAMIATTALASAGMAALLTGSQPASAVPAPDTRISTPYVVLGWNDLGMHCMNSDFSELMVLPPFNTLHGQLIRRGSSPDIETSTGDFEMRYFIPGNTHSADKTNFWDYWQDWLGPQRPPNIGLAGAGLAGPMSPTGTNDWAVVGIPLVPIDDNGKENPYPLATIEVRQRGTNNVVARTQAVVPVSTEMSCNLCHNLPGMTTATDILLRHDMLHQTDLLSDRPVLCASCHASNALTAWTPSTSKRSATPAIQACEPIASATCTLPRESPARNATETCWR
ncbi:MAG: hypothetical protein HZB38_10045 [Planctomycetes bacterium]|nr:hypothetical protein [Planctomycetota bacterium]